MVEDRVTKWQHRIEETFRGPSGIVGERLLKLKNVESQIFEYMLERFSGYVRLMDAFLDFYIETLQNVATRERSKWTTMISVLSGIHIPTFWRFRASYLIFWDGYFIDAVSLLRAILENVLQISALKHEIITLDEVFGKLKSEDSKNLSEEEAYKLIRKNIKKSDTKVYSQLIGKNSGLSANAIKDLETFFRLLHNAVHKSKLNFLWFWGPWSRCERGFPIFPKYNEDTATLYTNSSMFIGWMVTRTFPLLQINPKEFPKNWHSKYQVLDESFKEAVANFPKRLGHSVEELIAKKFNFNIT